MLRPTNACRFKNSRAVSAPRNFHRGDGKNQWNHNARTFATRRAQPITNSTSTAAAEGVIPLEAGVNMWGLGAIAAGLFGLSFFGWGSSDDKKEKEKNKELKLYDAKTATATHNVDLAKKAKQVVPYLPGKPDVVFWLGGHTTPEVREYIVNQFGYIPINAGDLLDSEIASGSLRGRVIKQYAEKGEAVPAEIILELLDLAMSRDPKKKFILEDFPRNDDDATKWDAFMKGRANLRLVVHIADPAEPAVEPTTGKSPYTEIGPFKLKKRIYKEQALPVLQHYGQSGITTEVDGTQESTKNKITLREAFQHIEDFKRNA